MLLPVIAVNPIHQRDEPVGVRNLCVTTRAYAPGYWLPPLRYLVRVLDEDRLSDRPLFPPELKGVTW